MNDVIGSLRNLFRYIVFFLIGLINRRRQIITVPANWLAIPSRSTNRRAYKSERNVYRLTGALIRRGDLIEARDYYIYKQIANKYGWPYIKESYDQEESIQKTA